MSNQRRQPAGQPTGGQFAADTRPESTVPLTSRRGSPALEFAWRADMTRLRPALEPHVVTIDGSAYLADTCPPHLADLHAKLTQIGFANGYL